MGMRRPQRLFPNNQRPPIQRLSLAVASGGVQQQR